MMLIGMFEYFIFYSFAPFYSFSLLLLLLLPTAPRVSIRQISNYTGMDPHDIAATLQLLNMFKLSPEGDIMIAPDPVLLEKHMEKVREREREEREREREREREGETNLC